MNVFGYIRVSGKGQIDGDGPERQAEKIESFCKAQGLDKWKFYHEEGVSGTVEAMARPSFSQMLSDIENCIPLQGCSNIKVEAIVVERLDRLARDLMVSEFLLAECRKRGIKVYAADQGQLIDMASNEGDPSRILIRQILAALAQWERAMLVAKLDTARARIRAKTGKCEGAKRYGELEGEQRVLTLAKNLYEQKVCPAHIAMFLNDGGFKTRFGKPWSRHTVQNILGTTREEYNARQ